MEMLALRDPTYEEIKKNQGPAFARDSHQIRVCAVTTVSRRFVIVARIWSTNNK
jgi:hypothetical protein